MYSERYLYGIWDKGTVYTINRAAFIVEAKGGYYRGKDSGNRIAEFCKHSREMFFM